MTVYVDAILLINFLFDLLILITTKLTLKRNTSTFRLILGAFIGSLTIIVLFFNINTIELLLIKIYLSIIMNLVTFGHKDIKYTLTNILTFYIISILLGGFLYMLNIEFSYKHNGLIFYNNGFSINIIILLISSPIIMYIYRKQAKIQKRIENNYHKTKIIIGKKEINLIGYMDTGNTLTYKNKPVILTNKPNTYKKKKIYIPYMTIRGGGLLESIEAKIEINNNYYEVLLGFSENLKISGAEVLLNNKLEDI